MPAAIQDSVEYYILRRNRLYGPLSREKIGFAIARKIFSDDDKISSDQLNWIPLRDFNPSPKPAGPKIPSLTKTPGGGNPQQDGIRLSPAVNQGPDSEDFLPDDNQEAPPSNTRIHIVFAVVAVLLLAGIGAGLYFTYDYIFNSSTVSSSDIAEINEIMTLLAKKNEGKITRKEFWQEAKRLAKENNPLVGWMIFGTSIGDSDDDLRFNKHQREKIYEMLGSEDEWSALVKIAGETVSVKTFISSLKRPEAREQAQKLFNKMDDDSVKRFITIPLEKIDYARLSLLIYKTRDTNLLFKIWFQMWYARTFWEFKQKSEKTSANPPNEIIHEVAKRFAELKLLPLSYQIDMVYYKKGSHDYNTVEKKYKEEISESRTFKLETSDFKGFGFFIVERGTLYYRHIRGDKPYRVKINDDLWRKQDLGKKYVLMKKNPGIALIEPKDSPNLMAFDYNGVIYMMPKKKGAMSAEFRIFKDLEKE